MRYLSRYPFDRILILELSCALHIGGADLDSLVNRWIELYQIDRDAWLEEDPLFINLKRIIGNSKKDLQRYADREILSFQADVFANGEGKDEEGKTVDDSQQLSQQSVSPPTGK